MFALLNKGIEEYYEVNIQYNFSKIPTLKQIVVNIRGCKPPDIKVVVDNTY